jgi:hypothetical protein
MRDPLPDYPYFVIVTRAQARPVSDVWPIALRERLPTIGLPLLPDDADVPLDLQESFDSAYDVVGFDLLIDYSSPPEVPLAGEDAAWVQALLSRRI